ncbi:hypothetical protein RvY_09340 [Ramazzottius varieornatus]|uniref:PDZ domain-containing protein n=1 Tax=Ramazzottius varieornatus TaxID=947166 RepID=A0A1D1VB70_RAMVA|nr:hypothetical protein RvY_09340 [Ramazzottius varieornatus]
MATTVQVPDRTTRFAVDFDKELVKIFPSTQSRLYLKKVLNQYQIGFTTAAMLARRLTELVHSPEQMDLFDLCRPMVRLQDQLKYSAALPYFNKNRIDRVVLKRRYLEEDFGFRVCGGKDQKCAIFVSSVDRGSPALINGLRPGLEVLRVNGLTTANVTHRMFVDYVKINFHLELLVKRVGMVPLQSKSNHENPRWVFASWNAENPGKIRGSSNIKHSTNDMLLYVKDLPAEETFGVHVRPHPDGILVSAVKPGSSAATAHIKAGDVITEVNEIRLDGLDFEESVAHLKTDPPFTLRVLRSPDSSITVQS